MKYNMKYILTITILLFVIFSLAWKFYLNNNSTTKTPKRARLVDIKLNIERG